MDKTKDAERAEDTYDERLKGTFISVLAIGASIILSWIIVFNFYISTL